MEKIAADLLLKGLAPEGFADSQPIGLVTTDSREVCPGCIFVAFPGERFDGHDFAARALEEGAAYVVLKHPVEGVPAERAVISPDSYHAMMVMGANYRSQFHPKVVGVTGSVGKTTTKQMTYAAIAGFGNTIKTEGNQNNELGLPRTIGVSHIGNLGSQENICKAKLEICAGLAEGSPLVLNGDDPFLRKAALPTHVRPVWFSLGDENADICALDVRQEGDGMAFTLCDKAAGRYAVTIPAMGRHNVANALAAYAAATRLDLAPEGVIAGLADFEQTGMRQKVVHAGSMDVIEDCYNANPDSMKAALAMFKEYPCKRRFALLGDMLELGGMSAPAHEELGRQAAEAGLTALVTYGPEAARTAKAAKDAGLADVVHAEDYSRAADALLARMAPGDALLVKASRGMALEKALALFYPVCTK